MPGVVKPRRRDLKGANQFRIIPSRFPPISIYEDLVEPDELEIAYALESMTNDRLQAEAGNLYLLDKKDWVTGPGASVVMAAFTHIGRESRFSDGSYGLYYAGLDEETAIAETVFHQERRLRETSEAAIEIDMRCYLGTVNLPLEDIRGPRFSTLQDSSLATWPACQRFAAERRADEANGLLYKSARNAGGECISCFITPAVSLPTQSKHLRYCWNGTRVDRVLSVESIRQL
ncbi:MAG: RES family NAD+ phosphorylase [bacterium]|nr:RES family NAD+ phosphorylase [bacterium]